VFPVLLGINCRRLNLLTVQDMATTDTVFDFDELASKQCLEADSKRLHELQIIHAELKSLHKGSQVYSRIANGNVFLLTSHDSALSNVEKELKSPSHVNIKPVS